MFKTIYGNIAGVDWEVEIQETVAHMQQLNNNKYVELAGDEDDEENETKITGVENDIKITRV